MHEHLERCLAIVLAATEDARPESRVRRDPQQWSAVEVVEHLARSYSGTAKGFERALEKGAPLATGATLKQRVSAFVLINFGYFPAGRAAPKHIVPTGELDLRAVVDAVRHDLQRLDIAAVRARERFGGAKVLDHPILGAFTVDQWMKFHLVHTRHHEKQIRARR